MIKEYRKYLDEACGLGLFMLSAAFFDGLLNYPGLPLVAAIPSPLLRRFLVGLAMGLTALYIFTSSFGKQSGAYINPAVTLVRYRLGNIGGRDAVFYTLFQLIGGAAGMAVVAAVFPSWMKYPTINYIVTVPGPAGRTIAFVLEWLMSMALILVVLFMGQKKRTDKWSAPVLSTLIMLYITFESPFSGMSINPARTFASAIVAGEWKDFWIYCLAPVGGMICGEKIFLFITKHRPE